MPIPKSGEFRRSETVSGAINDAFATHESVNVFAFLLNNLATSSGLDNKRWVANGYLVDMINN